MIVSLVAASLGFLTSSKPPKWLDTTIAGYVLDHDESHSVIGVYDKEKDYYLARTAECDGADLSLILTKDRHVVDQAGFAVPSLKGSENHTPLKLGKLPSLSTGKGIRIGDSQETVRRILGAPKGTTYEGSRKQYVQMKYQWVDKREQDSTIYEQSYTFKQGHLIEIQFGRYHG